VPGLVHLDTMTLRLRVRFSACSLKSTVTSNRAVSFRRVMMSDCAGWRDLNRMYSRPGTSRLLGSACVRARGCSPEDDMPDSSISNDDWRRDLRRKLLWAFIAKMAGLGLLWFFFFRGSHS
jgi:hypothetical protein